MDSGVTLALTHDTLDFAVAVNCAAMSDSTVDRLGLNERGLGGELRTLDLKRYRAASRTPAASDVLLVEPVAIAT